MNKQIVRREIPEHLPSLPPALSPTHALLLQRIYAARGIRHSEELDHSLGQLQPYHRLKDIDLATQQIAAAVMTGKRILIVGDFDCDGATSSALAVLALRAMGAAWVDYLVPNRFEYGYGLSPEIVEVARQRQPDLLITVDNGISSIEGVDAAKRAGITVVVTDHHLPGNTLPAADALVNPNQHACDFPAKNTCGVGVIFYVMSALRRHLESRDWFSQRQLSMPNMAHFLDLVALGTVADVVSLDHNNRILVAQGLSRMRAGRARPGILALLEVAGRKRESLKAADLGFALGPRINAAGRLEDMSIGIECLLTDDPQRARELAGRLEELNQERKSIEQSMQQQALEALDRMSLEDGDELPHGVCLFDESWHEGVIGILASRIKERLHRPVIACAATDNGGIKGSARSIPGLHIRDALDAIAARHPQLLSKFGGHAIGAGLSLNREHLPAFKQAFDEEVRRQLNPESLRAKIDSDGELDAKEINLQTALCLQEAGPWGQHFQEPLFDGIFSIVQQRIVGQRHLKLLLSAGNGGLYVDAIAFNVDLDQWPNNCNSARIAYRLDINEFRGQRSVQLLIEHLEPR